MCDGECDYLDDSNEKGCEKLINYLIDGFFIWILTRKFRIKHNVQSYNVQINWKCEGVLIIEN